MYNPTSCHDHGRKGEGLGEWMMVELQGELKTASHDTVDGKWLGDLHFNKQVSFITLTAASEILLHSALWFMFTKVWLVW